MFAVLVFHDFLLSHSENYVSFHVVVPRLFFLSTNTFVQCRAYGTSSIYKTGAYLHTLTSQMLFDMMCLNISNNAYVRKCSLCLMLLGKFDLLQFTSVKRIFMQFFIAFDIACWLHRQHAHEFAGD